MVYLAPVRACWESVQSNKVRLRVSVSNDTVPWSNSNIFIQISIQDSSKFLFDVPVILAFLNYLFVIWCSFYLLLSHLLTLAEHCNQHSHVNC